jgi:hypothetical protein
MAELHSSIVALVSLASGIASNHTAMGQCQLSKLRSMGISEDQIATVIEIARHIRNEAGDKIDQSFDQVAYPDEEKIEATQEGESCCSSTASGQSCCS